MNWVTAVSCVALCLVAAGLGAGAAEPRATIELAIEQPGATVFLGEALSIKVTVRAMGNDVEAPNPENYRGQLTLQVVVYDKDGKMVPMAGSHVWPTLGPGKFVGLPMGQQFIYTLSTDRFRHNCPGRYLARVTVGRVGQKEVEFEIQPITDDRIIRRTDVSPSDPYSVSQGRHTWISLLRTKAGMALLCTSTHPTGERRSTRFWEGSKEPAYLVSGKGELVSVAVQEGEQIRVWTLDTIGTSIVRKHTFPHPDGEYPPDPEEEEQKKQDAKAAGAARGGSPAAKKPQP